MQRQANTMISKYSVALTSIDYAFKRVLTSQKIRDLSDMQSAFLKPKSFADSETRAILWRSFQIKAVFQAKLRKMQVIFDKCHKQAQGKALHKWHGIVKS